jgi:hypothetical protein
MDVTFGFDPGGAGEFGWAVLETSSSERPALRVAGTAWHASNAIDAACAELRSDDRVLAAGIDSPMYWTPSGDRVAETIVRNAMRSFGAPNVGGTVQHPNSLRGACVVQGPTTALLLRQRFAGLPITESHPKAMLWLMRVARSDHLPRDLTAEDLEPFVLCRYSSEHERDAVLAAWAARAMVVREPGWTDLVEQESAPLFVAGHVGYWLPLAAITSTDVGRSGG